MEIVITNELKVKRITGCDVLIEQQIKEQKEKKQKKLNEEKRLEETFLYTMMKVNGLIK